MLIPILFYAGLAGGLTQESAPQPAAAAADTETHTATAEELRGRINSMRMDLLLGGDRVRAAEAEAIDFYGQKREFVEQRLDTLESDLSEKRATYDVLAGRALDASTPELRRKALGEAAGLRAELSSMERETGELGERRNRLRDLVGAVEARDRERQKLAADLETGADATSALGGIPFAGIGLAPAAMPVAEVDPLTDDALVADLLERDPAAARRLLFELDPKGYFDRFPLQPPAALLPTAIPFPLPDPPGRR